MGLTCLFITVVHNSYIIILGKHCEFNKIHCASKDMSYILLCYKYNNPIVNRINFQIYYILY